MRTEQWALVTGAGRGIGRAIAIELARNNISVVLIARSVDELEETRSLISEISKVRSIVYPCDIRSSQQVQSLAEDLDREEIELEILINNAGVAPSEKLENTTDEMWEETMAVNVTGAFYLCRALVPPMKIRKHGRVINIASLAALHGYRYTAAYTASKHALLGLSRALDMEFRGSNIIVSTICPGFVRTSIVENSISEISRKTGKSESEAEEALASLNAEGRLLEPEEIAKTVAQLVLSNSIKFGGIYVADGTLLKEIIS